MRILSMLHPDTIADNARDNHFWYFVVAPSHETIALDMGQPFRMPHVVTPGGLRMLGRMPEAQERELRKLATDFLGKFYSAPHAWGKATVTPEEL